MTPKSSPPYPYARRTRELIDDEYEDDSESSSNASSYRRARAGTLPSRLPEPPLIEEPTPPVYIRTSALSPVARPALRHTNSSVANLETGNRNRSGSLTQPIGNAFGGAFSSTWLANPGLTSQARSPLGGQDDERVVSPIDPDDLNFSTLDYLGLADGAEALPPASMSELRNQAQRAIAKTGPASRLRASTVSNFARHRPSVTTYPQENYDHQEEEILAVEQLGIYDQPYLNLYAANKDPHRSRATTIGALDQMRTRQYPAPFGYNYGPRSHSDRDLTRSRESSTSRGPRLSSGHPSRAATPDVSTPQQPTRSLWIGNLDVNATSEALLHVFAPYGAIESLRMLPEKTCAFVNFMEKGDAIKARDDVLNRLGGHLSVLSETAPVRIGFGKIDSAPTGVPVSTIAPAPPGLVFTNGVAPSITVPPNMDAILGNEQSSLPTRALWIGSIPNTTSSATLLQIFSPFGPVESARVLTHKSCGFINFEHLDSAISARQALNGRDILGSDIGAIRIGFARVPVKTPQIGGPEEDPVTPRPDEYSLTGLSQVKGAAAVTTEQQLSVEGGGVENYRSQLVIDLVKAGVHEQVLEKGLANGGVVSEQQMIMQVLSGGQGDQDGDVKAAADPRPAVTYYTSIPLITDRPANRRFDAARLRDLRKRLDSGLCGQEEIDDITRDTLEECAELASDYIGNTVVQKLFERTSPQLRLAMLERIAPHLAMIGIHKNGTWAAQKIIECSTTDEERALVVSNLRAFCPPLMGDSLGNYVCAGTLRFGEPHNSYVFDSMVDRMWDIAQNRFGARCMRTCLESSFTSLYQKKRIATGVILNSIPLATNPNGALLLTWLVDSSALPGRYKLLANRFAPHVTHLCTHKLASLTVLRIIGQISEPSASSTLINAIFSSPNDAVLTEVLSDANNGSQVIGKIRAMSSLNSIDKETITTSVRRVLPTIKASTTPPYRRLLEEFGLPVPTLAYSPQRTNWSPNYQPQQQQNYYPQPSYPNANLSPLMMNQNMSLGQAMRSPNPRTPVQQQRGRLSPSSQLMSPASDPFNPFASPSVDVPYLNQSGFRLSQLNQPAVTFEQQPNVGGLGTGTQNEGYYQSQNGIFTNGYQN